MIARVEHLPDDVLLEFCPMILGRYSPRLFLLTTPCYDFNQLFTPPANLQPQDLSPDSSVHARSPPIVREGGFLDPTGRTTRVFRHSDHKFEWTRDEFTRWCTSQAEQWGYDVECGGLGRAMDADPWGRDLAPHSADGGAHPHPLRATSTAVFRRRADRAHAGPETNTTTTTTAHERILALAHAAHPASNRPKPPSEIRAAVQACLRSAGAGAAEVADLWVDDALACACGGTLEALFAAVDGAGAGADECVWDGDEEDGAGRSRWRRRIVWRGYAEWERERAREQAREQEHLPTGVPLHEEGEGDEVSLEDSPWANEDWPDQSDWGTRVDNSNSKADVGWNVVMDDREGGGDWNRDADANSWGSPELDGWGDWDEEQCGETSRNSSGR